MLDDHQLLEVFLAEIGFVGIGPIKQTFDDDAHTVEMSGAESSFHYFVELAEVIDFFGWLGENLLGGWCENHIHVGLDFLQVTFHIAWIFLQVNRIVELNRVDKNGADHYFVFLFGSLHQRQMAIMQGTHGGNKSY